MHYNVRIWNRQGAVTSLNSLSRSPSTRRHIVGQAMFGVWSNRNTAMSRQSKVLLDSEHRLQTLQQLRSMLMSLTSCCPTTWSWQHWPQRVTANDFSFTGINQRPAGRYFGRTGICNGRRSRFLALAGERVKHETTSTLQHKNVNHIYKKLYVDKQKTKSTA